MLWKVCLALAVAMVLYVLLTNRAPAAPNRFDGWSDDEVSMEGVVATALALGDRLKTEHAVVFDNLRIRSSPDRDEQVACGTFTLPGSAPAKFFGFGVGLGLKSQETSSFDPAMVGSNVSMNDEIEAMCRTAGF